MKRFLVLSLAAALALSGCNAAASQTGAAADRLDFSFTVSYNQQKHSVVFTTKQKKAEK